MNINRQNLEDLNKILEMTTLIQQNLETLNNGNHLKDKIPGFVMGYTDVKLSTLLAGIYLELMFLLKKQLQ